MNPINHFSSKFLTLILISLLSACGGGGGGSNTPEPPPIVIDNIPIAVDDAFSTDEDVAVSGNVSSNDTGLQDTPVTFETTTAPASGTLNLSTNGQFTYTPTTGIFGEVTFIYRVTDSDGDFDSATVTITINEIVVDYQPVANDDAFRASQNQDLAGNVATNDTDLDDTPVTFLVVTEPANGTLVLEVNGTFTYTPDTNFSGSDSFEYRITDNDGDTDSALVTITIDPNTSGVTWPAINIGTRVSGYETAVTQTLNAMTTEEKVGQLIMAEIQNVTPEEVKTYNLGGILNGGGSWPGNNNRATAADWVALADQYYLASTDTSDGGVGVPVLWGTDAVHGHNNVYGATLFPHNIGLGAGNNAGLVNKIGEATARQVRATGLRWTFAPTVATVRDDRWGRTYEGYSEDPAIVAGLAGNMVAGLQGFPGSGWFNDFRVIATVKHFIGDGGTTNGIDQGNTEVDEQTLQDIHGPGFYSALNAAAQVVMASYNSWNGNKLHGSQYLLTTVLRDQMGFDGFVVGDWNGHAQIPGCSTGSCPQAINAGVDMIMVPTDWRNFYNNTLAQVQTGTISMARLDEAVSRILRVKYRSGYTLDRRPSYEPNSGDQSLLADDDAKIIAQQAVRESLVLLKNKNSILPLSRNQNVLVAGSGADNIGQQTGGWSLSWQGDIDNNSEYPNATSIYAGIQAAVAAGGGTITLSASGSFSGPNPDVAIVVFGETPYAEGAGDLNTLEYQAGNKSDLALLQSLKSQGIPVVSIFLSGRPMWVNAELNASNAFVAAWLPGTEGDGIAEVIFTDNSGAVANDFIGKLSYSWPNAADQTPLNSGDVVYAPLFELGFGLTYQDIDTLGDNLDEGTGNSGPIVFNVPTDLIEAEDYSVMSGIQLETTSDTGGGQNIGFVDIGDWLEYEINVSTTGSYEIQYRIASLPGSGGFRTTINNIVAHIQSVPSTGGWQNWQTVTQTVTLSAGRQTLRLDAIGNEWNLNWIRFNQQ